jgi:hypothetical protein
MALGGMNEREIRDRIKAEIEDTSVNIHGLLIPDHRDLPEDFPVLMEDEMQAAFEVFGKQYGMESAQDLSIVPVSGQSKWQIIDKRTGFPIGSSYVTPQSLDVLRQKKSREHDEMVLQMVKAKDADRAKYQQQYDAEIQGMKDQIVKFRGRSGVLSQNIANYLQGVLDDRLERDKLLMSTTPDQRFWDAIENHPARQVPGAAKVSEQLLPQ